MSEEIKEVWVMDYTYNWYKRTYAHVFPIVPLSKVKYEVISRYSSGNIKVIEPSDIGQYFLYKRKRFNVANCLLELGLEPRNFIEPVTVHVAHKTHMWQGIVFTNQPERWELCKDPNCHDGTEHYHVVQSCGYTVELPTYNISDYEAIKYLIITNHVKIVKV